MADNKETEIKVKVDSTQAAKSLNDLKKEWLAAEKAANSAAIGTKEYAKAQEEAAGKKNAYEGAKKDAAELRKENANLVESFGKFTPASGIIGDLSTKFTQAKASVVSLGSTIFTLSGAMLAIPIVALVAGFTALFTYFTKTDEGAVKLESITRALNATFDVLIGRVARAGEGLFKLLTGDFQGAAKAVEGLFTDIGDEIATAASKAASFAAEFDKLDDQQRALAISNSENEKQITQLLLQSKNRAKSEQERLDLLDKASAIETRNFLEKKAYAEAELKLIEDENALAIKSGTIQDEALQKATDARVRLINLEQESINLQEKIENRRSALLDAQAADREKKQKAMADMEKQINAVRLSLIQNDFQREAQILAQKYQDDYKKAGDNAELKKLLEEKYLQDTDSLYEKYETKRKADQQAETQATLAQIEEDNKARLAKEIEGLDIAKEAVNTQIQAQQISGLISQENANNAKLDNDKTYLTAKLQLLKNAGLEESKEARSIANQLTILNAQKNAQQLEDDRKTAQAKAQMLGSFGNLVTSLMQLNAVNGQQNTDFQKGLAISSIAINTAQALSATIAGASAAAAAGGPAAPFLLVGYIASGIATVLTATAQASQLLQEAQKPQQPTFQKSSGGNSFAHGGIIDKGSYHGNSYGSGGIALIDRVSGREVGEMERDETILTGNVARDPVLRAAASRLNVLAGGRSFAEGGVVNAQTVTNRDTTSPSADTNTLLITAINKIDQWQETLTVLNVITDTDKALTELNNRKKIINI